MSLIEAIRSWQLLTWPVLYLSSISLQSRAPEPLETPVMFNAISLCTVIQFAQHSYSCAYITPLRADCEAPPPLHELAGICGRASLRWRAVSNPHQLPSWQLGPARLSHLWPQLRREPRLQALGPMSHTGRTAMHGRKDDFQQNGLAVEA